ncbi:MAG TPA: diaminobutyrate--2-oxoglutarate transaminase [Streptosporangiaceae bacterium]|nr:diaminobutyrate--2-oxoglutarate transaminase [Streptosporangiaceae bacterium]
MQVPYPAGQDVSTAGIFERRESEVRSYCRTWPKVFDRAAGSWLYDGDGRAYLDFFTGASALNYGHNNPALKRALIDYLVGDRVIHSLDMHTAAKAEFLTALDEIILQPRRLDYRVQFPGPGGANAVEAALKLARKVTGRTEVIGFSGAFHGMTLGALSVTGSKFHRGGAGVPLPHAVQVPFGCRLDSGDSGSPGIERLIQDRGTALGDVAAVIVETVQGEGGINVAPLEWVSDLAQLCQRHGIVLIVDDVQMGCGRTGPFFSFEAAGITPDIVCLSKSIGGYGLPLALTLIRPDLDIWKPGEHNGTFRGINPAFVTGTAALRVYWEDEELEQSTLAKGNRVATALTQLAATVPGTEMQSRGRGLANGLAFENGELAKKVSSAAFERGLLVETAGPDDEVIKLLPPLTATDFEIDQGLALLADAVQTVC